jgi:hypothetical protein
MLYDVLCEYSMTGISHSLAQDRTGVVCGETLFRVRLSDDNSFAENLHGWWMGHTALEWKVPNKQIA